MERTTRRSLIALSLAIASCTGTSGAAPDSGTAGDGASALGEPTIVLSSGGPLVATAGDVLRLDVMRVSTTGSRAPLPAGTTITWSGPPLVIALASGTEPSATNLPATSSEPTAFFLRNTEHYTDAELAGALFVIDAGSGTGAIEVSAHVIGEGIDTELHASIPVGVASGGDATRGRTYFSGNCAPCHGAVGEGGSAPGLNAAPGNVAADPDWNAALFASVTRGDIDDLGVAEGAAMPNWLIVPTPTGAPLTTADMLDVYAWLATQH